MNSILVVARSILAAVALITLAAASPLPAAAQDGSSSAQGEASGGDQAGSSASSDQEEPSFLESILPDFVKGWFGMDEGSEGADASGGGGAGGGQAGGAGGGQPSGPPAVVVAKAAVQSVGERFEFIGRIESIQMVTLQARVAGFIQDVLFKGGDRIRTGDKLFQIEPAEYQANLLAAQAQLASAQSQEAQAQRSLQRNQELAQNATVSQAQLDEARATFESAQGTRLQAEAQVRQAQLALDYTSITAPIDGEISEPLITKGNYVTVSSGALANLVQVDPIWGVFPIGENRLATWRRLGMNGERSQSEAEVEGYRLSLILPNEEEYDAEGSFSFVSNTVDVNTGTVEVRVSFPNRNGILLPNENVTLVASEKDPPRQPVIPQAAIQLDREGRSVFVLADDDTVRKVPVTVGKQLRGEVAVTSGLKGDEYVVVQGLQNIADGAKVTATVEDEASPGGAESPSEGGGQADSQQAGGDEASAGGGTQDQQAGAQGGQEAGTQGGEDEANASQQQPSEGTEGSGAEGEGASNAAEQNIGGQTQSETRAAVEAGPANKQTAEDPAPLSEPREQSESRTGSSENGT